MQSKVMKRFFPFTLPTPLLLVVCSTFYFINSGFSFFLHQCWFHLIYVSISHLYSAWFLVQCLNWNSQRHPKRMIHCTQCVQNVQCSCTRECAFSKCEFHPLGVLMAFNQMVLCVCTVGMNASILEQKYEFESKHNINYMKRECWKIRYTRTVC